MNIEKGISRFCIEENIEAVLTKGKGKNTCSFKSYDKRDLLIIGFCLEGQMIIESYGRKTLKEGQMFYLRSTENSHIHTISHRSLHYLIDLNQFENFLCSKDCNNIYVKDKLKIENIPFILKSYIDEIKEIKDTEQKADFLDYINLKSLLLNNLNWTLKLNSNNKSFMNDVKSDQYYIHRTKELITENLEQQIPAKLLVDTLGISLYKLQKIFKKSYGTTVCDFVRKVKIDNSKVFLRESSLSVIEISQRLGYENPSKFSTAFKNITGYTPTQYRKSIIN